MSVPNTWGKLEQFHIVDSGRENSGVFKEQIWQIIRNNSKALPFGTELRVVAYVEKLAWHVLKLLFVRLDIGWIHIVMGARCSVVVKALCYKPESRGFDTR
jgi:hypothetical protein